MFLPPYSPDFNPIEKAFSYVMAFRMLRMGRASALGVVTLLILSVVIGFWIYLLYRREKGEW